jgi:hypothetical protein
MTVRVVEIHATTTIVSIDFAGAVLGRVRPILNSLIADASEYLFEVGLVY